MAKKKTAGQWTDTKPVTLRQMKQAASRGATKPNEHRQYKPKSTAYRGGTVAARPKKSTKPSKGASKGRVEHKAKNPAARRGGTVAARPKKGYKGGTVAARPKKVSYKGGTVAARSKSRPKASNEKRTNITQTAGYWTDTKPVSLRQQYQKAPYYEGGTVAARPRRAAKKPNEHVHRRPATGQPQYSSNINAGAAKKTKELSKFLSNAAREAQKRKWN